MTDLRKKTIAEMVGIAIGFIMLIILCQGCAQMKASEFWEHPTMYKSNAHAMCSIGTFDQKCSDTEDNEWGWWGIPTPIKK